MSDIGKVMIDAGHGGEDPGAVFEGRREKDDALRLALAVGEILEDNGVDVMYTRVTDVYDTPQEKAEIANRSEADYLVSIHRNAMPVPGTASGIMSLVYENGGTVGRLGANINRELAQTGFADLGVVERPGLIILRRSGMPAVLVEAGFIDNPEDNALFDRQFQEMAEAIASGILETIREENEIRPEYYQVQVGAYRERAMAEEIARELSEQGYPAFYVSQDGYYKVRVGAFLNLDNAARMEMRLRQEGWPVMMVQEPGIF
ncbi:MAG TPA: N-acetylmuramoyl-L-alanine amidase [Candidatus Lachnoclostridium stercoripullorum]|uniref:N-acetylmuramoyl-L-alanine amidase n=1 Tax=Candidatus Lachnoclostridium stercoripullorum TaxID=2838635 RepID=A0A9D1W4I2_9FIRM|nr:N-acetylmuramoyl-L-alanine amidase [Candidatus Lachnoclostridium stercoripullorum]